MRSCLPLRPTLNHDSPLVYPGHPGSPVCAESARVTDVLGQAGAEPGDARAAAAARARRTAAARRRAAPRRPAVAGAAQPVHGPLVAARRLPAGVAVGAARATRGRADRRHARDDSPAHGGRLPRAPPADPACLRGAALAAPRLLAAPARRRPGSRRRGRSDSARGAADGYRAARVPGGAISEARSGRARLRLPDAARSRAGAAARPLGEERTSAVDDGGGVARAAARRPTRRSKTWCCATSPRSGPRRSQTWRRGAG